ncbi:MULTISPECIES: ROK family protein [unclassified Streptomyces]|uniref:ROK family protein n=1 Tax=unclassified Streptomyces TaxID=2593676 RepID=UPI002E1832D8
MIPVIEVGGTHVTAGLVDPADGRVERRTHRPLDPGARAEDILGAVCRCADALDTPAGTIWGVALPGPFDYARGIGLFADVGKFEALYGVDVRAALLDGMAKRPGGMVFLNDAHAFLLGECAVGAATGHTRVVGITLGTGVGSAFLGDGRILDRGPGVPPEGRMDLTTVDGGPLEESVSRRALVARYGEQGVDVRDIAERARAGERLARRVLDEAFGTLGAVLGPRLAAFEATALVVGGSMARSWDLVAPALHTGLAKGGWPPEAPDVNGPPPTRHTRAMRPAALAGDAALLGAARAVAARDTNRRGQGR